MPPVHYATYLRDNAFKSKAHAAFPQHYRSNKRQPCPPVRPSPPPSLQQHQQQQHILQRLWIPLSEKKKWWCYSYQLLSCILRKLWLEDERTFMICSYLWNERKREKCGYTDWEKNRDKQNEREWLEVKLGTERNKERECVCMCRNALVQTEAIVRSESRGES